MILSKLGLNPAPGGKLRFEEWRIDQIPQDVVIMLIGKRGSGKTTLLMDILYHMRGRFDVGMAVTGTKDTAKILRRCIDDSLIYDDMKDVDHVISQIKLLQDMMSESEDCHRPRKIYFIADDCMFDKKAFKTKNIRDLLMNGRHYSITFINSAQYLMDIGTDYRSQIDYVIVMGETCSDTKDKLFDIFFRHVFEGDDGKRTFMAALKKLTQDYRCMVLDNKRNGWNTITEKIFWYKATPTEQLPPFHLNKPIFRKLHQVTYIPLEVRQSKIKQELIATNLARIHGGEDFIELKSSNARGRGRGRARGGSARPKLPPRLTLPPPPPRLALPPPTPGIDDDIKTNVTYGQTESVASLRSHKSHRSHRRRSPSPSTASHRSQGSQGSDDSGSSMSTLTSSFLQQPRRTRCRGGLCGVPREYFQGRRQR